MDLYITLAIIAIGIFLFIRNYFSIDTTSILIMALFIVSGVLNPEEGFAGFNHPATLTLGCMFVVSAAIFKTGLIDGLSQRVIKIAQTSYPMALLSFCAMAAGFSAFINDSAVVALLIPMALLVSRETGISPSRLLIPISFSALFGGTCTLIGTSTNILVSSYAEKSGLEPFRMFDFSLAALSLLAIGLVYLFFAAPYLLPQRGGQKEETLTREAEKYIAELKIPENSKDKDCRIADSKIIQRYKLQILAIVRNGRNVWMITGDTYLRENDVLKVLIEPESLSRLQESKEYILLGDAELPLQENSQKQIFEVMIPFGSALTGNSLKKLNFRRRYHSSVLAIRHRNETITKNLSEVVLREGDMLLIYGSKDELAHLISGKLLVILSEYKAKSVDYKRAIPALLIAIGVVTVAALGITSILISGMVGCMLLVITAILKPQEAYDAIDWKVIFMMAGVLSMGNALEKTGGSRLISEFLFDTMGGQDPRITLSLVFLVTFLSTNVLSSKAAAALMTPIVISLAAAMQVSERPFLVAVMFACSLTFMTPVSYPTNTMVYAPGNYEFKDYLKIGTPLNLIIWVAASFIIPFFFPF